MKSGLFIKILDSMTIELDESYENTIKRLRAQQGVCREADSQECPLEFTCTKKGKLRVDTNRYLRSKTPDRMYYVRGKVFAENGKTKVTIYTVHDRMIAFFRWAALFIDLVALALFIVVLLLDNALIQKWSIVVLLTFTAVIILSFFHTKKEQQYKSADLDIMKNEIVRRVEAVKRWND